MHMYKKISFNMQLNQRDLLFTTNLFSALAGDSFKIYEIRHSIDQGARFGILPAKLVSILEIVCDIKYRIFSEGKIVYNIISNDIINFVFLSL